ncbi:MAG TPA: CBS domain-containing protein, partial [Ktedonobacteraceae bacterium]|nr:CBS domain-containing protein [Ktedonobacteraceae bacterium]
MPRPIYVIGHKNSDLDAIASAYAYARLLRMQGEEQAIAARNGPLTPEVRFVLERFQVDPPEAMDDVYIHVRDVMRCDVICAYLNQPLLEAVQFLQEHNRHAMPVVDAENKVHGIIAIEDFAKLCFHNRNLQAVSRVSPERDNLVQLIHLSASTQEVMNRELDVCRPEDQLSEVQPKLRRHHSLP